MAEIVFTDDWQTTVNGELVPGSKFKVSYDSNRLPYDRSSYMGQPTWSIFANVQYEEDGSFEQKALQNSGEDSIMTQEFDIPQNAQKLIMWFVNSGRYYSAVYDSNYGQNYHFTWNFSSSH